MFKSIKQLYGDKLGATDGEIGHIKDFYFDDQSWAVRYLVADTGSWLPGRQVLISPHSLGKLYQPGKLLLVNLTRKQIENAPSIETHKPVSRQYEETYYRYYGWPTYWLGDGLWGPTAFPILEMPPKSKSAKNQQAPASSTGTVSHLPETHLRSTQAVAGYHLKTSDGMPGHVVDFLMDERTWAIGELLVKIGPRFSGKDVLIPVSKVDRISYEQSTVFVHMTDHAIEQSPSHHLAAAV